MVPARALIAAMSVSLLVACAGDPPPARTQGAAERAAQTAFEREQSEWRAQRLAGPVQPDG